MISIKVLVHRIEASSHFLYNTQETVSQNEPLMTDRNQSLTKTHHSQYYDLIAVSMEGTTIFTFPDHLSTRPQVSLGRGYLGTLTQVHQRS